MRISDWSSDVCSSDLAPRSGRDPSAATREEPPMPVLADRLSQLGTETAFEVLARANALAATCKSIINLGIGQPNFKTPDHIVEAGIKAMRDGPPGYTPAAGIPQLREGIAADLRRRHGVEIDPGLVMIMPGGKPTIDRKSTRLNS